MSAFADARVCAGSESLRITPSQEKRLFRGQFIEAPFGVGTRACAYKVGDDEVVKFTFHKPDAAAALAVAKRPVRGVLRVLDVRPVSDYHFAIRSKLVPLPGPVAQLAQQCAVAGGLDKQFVDRAQHKRTAPAKIPDDVRACIRIAGPRAGVRPADAIRFVDELSKTQARLARATGIHWFDVFHPGNFSQDAQGRPVIIDLGASIIPDRLLAKLKRQRTLEGAQPHAGTAFIVGGVAAALTACALAALSVRHAGR